MKIKQLYIYKGGVSSMIPPSMFNFFSNIFYVSFLWQKSSSYINKIKVQMEKDEFLNYFEHGFF